MPFSIDDWFKMPKSNEKADRVIYSEIRSRMPCRHSDCLEDLIQKIKIDFYIKNAFPIRRFVDDDHVLKSLRMRARGYFGPHRAHAVGGYCLVRGHIALDQVPEPETEKGKFIGEHAESEQQIRDFLLKLGEAGKAFMLHHLDGYSYEEIAHLMSCSVAAVRSMIHRAKEKLKELL